MKLVRIEERELARNELSPTLFQDFIDYIDGSEKTVETYTKNIKRFYEWLISNGISQPTRRDILDYREYLRENYKPSTISSYLSAVRIFFEWADTVGAYSNVAKNIKGAKAVAGFKKDYLTSSQVKKVLAQVDRSNLEGKRDYAILLLLFTGGLRTIELVRANREDMRTSGNASVLYVQGKGQVDKTQFIVLPQPTEEAIREYLKEADNTKDTAALFQSISNNNKGGRLSTRSVRGLVKDYLRKAGLESDRLTAHSTRHTAVTLSLLQGNTLQEAQQFARHANIATTQIYAHNLDRAKNQCSHAIAEAILG